MDGAGKLMKKCFTINPLRSRDQIHSYTQLLKDGTYQAVEIFYPGDQSREQYSMYTEEMNKIALCAKEMVMHLPFGPKYDLCDQEHADVVLPYMKDALAYANMLGIKKNTLHLGYHHPNQDTYPYLIPILQQLCDLFPNQYLMIENMPNDKHVGYAPTEIKRIIEQVNRSNLKFIYDTGHGQLSGFSFQQFYEHLGSYLTHFHVNDNRGARDDHQRIGWGIIDFVDILKTAKEYNELFCMEILYQTKEDLIMYANDFNLIGEK